MAREKQVALENMDRFAYARDNGHLAIIEKMELCDRYFEGNQWDDAIRARLERLGKPVITINKVLATCAAIFGDQLQNRADVRFRPAKEGLADVANALDKVWMHIATTNNVDWLESEVAADGFIRSRGFFDVRMNFDDHIMGEARIKQLNSKNVVIDPDADTYDPDGWKECFVTRWLTANDIERLYGDSYARELRGRPQHAFTSQYDTVDWLPDSFGNKADNSAMNGADIDDESRRLFRIIERQYKELRMRECFVDLETGDTRPIPEGWGRERIAMVMQQYNLGTYKKKVEEIRWTSSVDNIVLHDSFSPYRHFTPVPYFPFFRHGKTIGIVENLISPQDLLNKSISQELHIVNTTANSGWVMKNGSLINMTPEELEERGGEDGLVLVTAGGPKDIDKIQPNQVPSGIDRLSFKADEGLKEVSMVSDSMRGFDRADVAAKAIQAKQSRGQVSLTKPFENLALTRKILARNVLDLVQTFYTETRVLDITGRNLTDQPEQITINEVTPEGEIVNDLTVGEYDVIISTVPARESVEQSQFMEALEMRQLGIMIPDDVLVEHSHLNRKNEIAERIKEANGGGDPSEAEQEMQQLDMELKRLELEEKRADTKVKNANALLNEVRAQKERMEAEGDGDTGEADKVEAELVKMAMERERMLEEITLQREKTEEEIDLMWAKFRLESRMNNARIELERDKAEGQQDIAEKKLKADTAAKKEQAKIAAKQTEAKGAYNKAQKPKPEKGDK